MGESLGMTANSNKEGWRILYLGNLVKNILVAAL
jgi:hypothetical protein